MSHNVREYWRRVRELEASLDPFVWLAKDNAITETPAAVAAPLLQAGAHRIATAAEIATEKARGQAAAKQAKHERLRRSGQAIVVVDPPEEGELGDATSPRPLR